MNSHPILPGLDELIRPFRSTGTPHEFKVTSLRECPTPESLLHCDTPDKAAEYWRLHIAAHPYFNPECECFAALLLNTRRRIKGHHLVSIGTQDTLLVHPREVFRVAIVTAASALIIMHNHPSGVIPHPVLCRMRSGLGCGTHSLSIWMRHKTVKVDCR